jgi:hypothetical protein
MADRGWPIGNGKMIAAGVPFGAKAQKLQVVQDRGVRRRR